jgi:hypothetical protein
MPRTASHPSRASRPALPPPGQSSVPRGPGRGLRPARRSAQRRRCKRADGMHYHSLGACGSWTICKRLCSPASAPTGGGVHGIERRRGVPSRPTAPAAMTTTWLPRLTWPGAARRRGWMRCRSRAARANVDASMCASPDRCMPWCRPTHTDVAHHQHPSRPRTLSAGRWASAGPCACMGWSGHTVVRGRPIVGGLHHLLLGWGRAPHQLAQRPRPRPCRAAPPRRRLDPPAEHSG